MKKIIVLVSGNGTNLQAIIDSTQNNVLPYCKVEAVFCDKKNANALKRAKRNNINCFYVPKKKEETREQYDTKLATEIKKYEPDLIVLAGWMRILTKEFLNSFSNDMVINLHPALPKKFPGANAIKDAFIAYQNESITETGVMVHNVVEEIDAGKVLQTQIVPIYKSDTFDSLRERVCTFEKITLINAIFHYFYRPNVTTVSQKLRL